MRNVNNVFLCFGIVLCIFCVIFVFFFFKQKTAYEMRISDWSSDVCSSDLHLQHWLETVANARVHGTTGRVPREHFEQEERQHLRSYLSPTSLVLRGSCAQTRRADKTGLISWKSNKYSVPTAWQRANVGVAEQIGRASCRERVCQCVY